MTIPVEFHPLASIEVVEAEGWYEAQGRGLGDRFLAAIQSTLRQIGDWPNIGTPTILDERGAPIERRATTKGFPYAIEYRIVGDTVFVLAVHHQRRRPGYWAERSTPSPT